MNDATTKNNRLGMRKWSSIPTPVLAATTMRFAVPAIFLLGLALRLLTIDMHGLWFDEVMSIETARRGLATIFTDRFGWMVNQPALHYLIVWLTIQPTDPATTTLVVRLPSALAGSFTALLTYGIGNAIFGRAQGLVAGLMAALSAVFLDYSQDVRPYAMLTFLTALSVYCLLIAERTGAGRWWLAFAAASILNMLNSYMGLLLVTPALAPYLLLALQWMRARPNSARTVRYALFAVGAMMLVGAGVLLDMAQVPRIPLDLGQLTPISPIASIIDLVSWFMRFGIGGQLERAAQLCLLLIALWGAYRAARHGRWRGALLCWLLIVIPCAILSIIGTTNVVFQRYALFALPFWFLLIANGLAPTSSEARTSYRLAALALCVGTLSLFLVGDFVFFSPGGHDKISFRPDNRGVAAYLASEARPYDLIIFTAEDPTLAKFYWENAPPAPSYSVLDPRLYRQKAGRSIFWIASDANVTLSILSNPRWRASRRFEGRVALREDATGGDDVAPYVTHWVDDLERAGRKERDVTLMRASIYQALGDIAHAVSTYKRAGAYFPIGDLYLGTARGFAERGDLDRAWRDAIIAKAEQPGIAAVHEWFATMLKQAGYGADSDIATQIAHKLR